MKNVIIAPNTASIESFQNEFECIQCDFADKFVGGGVLKAGCAQEEIMFITAPELIPTVLFCSVLTDLDSLIVSGAEQYSATTGFR